MNAKRTEILRESKHCGGDAMRGTLLIFVLAGFLVGCTQAPAHTDAWLSIKYGLGCGDYAHCSPMIDFGEADQYNIAIGIGNTAPGGGVNPMNFGQWKKQFGYPGNGVAEAIYGNQLDLQFGRDMNCWQFGQGGVACYVTNYGPPPGNPGWPDLVGGFNDAIHGNNPFAIVAMAYDPNGIGVNNDKVTFSVFQTLAFPGNLDASPPARLAGLDEEGAGKSIPRMCMACHGGTYNTDTHSVTGASFLPFDVWSFYYNSAVTAGPYDLYLQEQFRKLNAMVLATNPNPPIVDLINGLYPTGVKEVLSQIRDDSYVPAGWMTPDNSGQKLYKGVFRRYCRMCHLASNVFPFNTYADFQSSAQTIANIVTCNESNNVKNSHDMPHAEVPFGGLAGTTNRFGAGQGFWMDSVAQTDLKSLLKNTTCQ